MYNILDVNETVIESNLSEEAVTLLLEDTTTTGGFSYFYYPIESVIMEKLKEEKGESIRFIKPVVAN
jgi:hypothetical protein